VRLRAVSASPVTLRCARPLWTARGTFTERSCVILEIRDENGVAGYGEAAPWPGFRTESVAESLAVLRRAERLLRDADIEPGEWPALVTEHFSAAPAARAALAGAVWDLGARRAGRPLAEFLAARLECLNRAALESVAVSALLTESAPEALHAEAMRVREAGYRAAKLKLGAAVLAEDIARVRAAREGLGAQVALRGDANGAWSEQEAAAALGALAEFQLAYVEQPLAPDEIDALARLRRGSPVRIAADESVATEVGVGRLIEAGAVDVMVLKPSLLGGPGRALRLAARAGDAGCEVVFTHAFESAVGARHALHCAAAWGDPAAVHGLVTQGLFLLDVAEPAACHGGLIAVGREPGIGITVPGVAHAEGQPA